MEKNVLIVTYYWPPAGGPGVQRWLKFSKYLPELDYETHIFTAENANYALRDQTLESEINPKLKIIKFPIWEPYSIAEKFNKNNQKHAAGFFEENKKQSLKSRISLFIRGNFFIPDARKFWIKPSVKFLTKYILDNHIQTIITSGPPHSSHLIGLKIKEKMNVQWIADFRDPWTNIYYYKHLQLTNWADKKHHQLEKKVLETADKIISVNDEYRENYQKITQKPVFCLTNGYDSEDIPENIVLDEPFSLAYIGAMFQDRNPQILWEVLQELCNELDNFRKNLSIKFIGKIDDSIFKLIEDKNLGENIDYKGYLPHNEAVAEQFKSQILLLITGNEPEKKGNVPGKLFEYLASKRPIISFGPAESMIEKIINEANAGKHFLFDEKSKLKIHITEFYQLYLQKKLANISSDITKFHRKNLTLDLIKIIEK